MRDSNSVTELPLISSGRNPIFSIVAIIAVPIVVVLAVAFGISRTLAAHPTVWPLSGAMVVAFCAIPLIVIRIMKRAGAAVEGNELVIRTGFGAKRISLSNLRRHGLQVVDLSQHPELKLRIRTLGTSMPGFNAGRFVLRNGEKALCLITDPHRVAYLHSDADHVSLLLSLRNPGTLNALLER